MYKILVNLHTKLLHMTLLEFLNANKLPLDNEKRFILGKRIGQQYTALYGKCRTTIEENGFKVNNYPASFLNTKAIKVILNFINQEYKNKAPK